MNEINKISAVSEFEAESLQDMCEIRFDCHVTMYKAGHKKPQNNLFVKNYKPNKPQWFRNRSVITLDAIRSTDPCLIGGLIQNMFRDLENHIRQYQEHKI